MDCISNGSESSVVPKQPTDLAFLFFKKEGQEPINLALATDEEFHQLVGEWFNAAPCDVRLKDPDETSWSPEQRVSVLQFLADLHYMPILSIAEAKETNRSGFYRGDNA